jgi:hypothetical protein
LWSLKHIANDCTQHIVQSWFPSRLFLLA